MRRHQTLIDFHRGKGLFMVLALQNDNPAEGCIGAPMPVAARVFFGGAAVLAQERGEQNGKNYLS